MFTNKALVDLDTAVVAAGGDKTEVDEEENGEEQGRDTMLELEAANGPGTEEMTKLRELAKKGSPVYLVDARGLLHIAVKYTFQNTARRSWPSSSATCTNNPQQDTQGAIVWFSSSRRTST